MAFSSRHNFLAGSFLCPCEPDLPEPLWSTELATGVRSMQLPAKALFLTPLQYLVPPCFSDPRGFLAWINLLFVVIFRFWLIPEITFNAMLCIVSHCICRGGALFGIGLACYGGKAVLLVVVGMFWSWFWWVLIEVNFRVVDAVKFACKNNLFSVLAIFKTVKFAEEDME